MSFTSKISFENLSSFQNIRISSGKNLILFTKVDKELCLDEWDYYLNFLPEFLQKDIIKYYRWQDRQNTLFGKLLIYAGYYMIYNRKIDFNNYSKSAYGKPQMENIGFEFNISHSGEMVVCAFSKEKVGIDIEQIIDIDIECFNSVFTSDEFKEIKSKKGFKFYEYWTAKEAVVKAIGLGLSLPLSEIRIMRDYVSYKDIKWFKEKIIFDNYFCTNVSPVKSVKSDIIEVKF
ncbi:4'-phosphopantetheinyl transferase superfamily protein [Zhouia spongiae]|uniref:4'-phosphopantetheinyl transferase superfamily protein n=1 Tax=Zhouia spongiae TaxID=2202721 RepID=A0ABY3YKM1_9FLAO|nr:4'-phosphopantetheinyl transferase superfamily protein [Zhouia spongiae]UNY98300.1 4'-phosphopantetheinyl transferase superfamily protein [Zhouia spongiae]